MNDVPMPPGIYALQLITIEGVGTWLINNSGGGCYPNGYAAIGGQVRNDQDFVFTIYGKNISDGGPIRKNKFKIKYPICASSVI